MNFDAVRDVADAYEQAVRTNASFHGRDVSVEAFAAIVGAAAAMHYPADRLEGLIRAAVEDARDPVQP